MILIHRSLPALTASVTLVLAACGSGESGDVAGDASTAGTTATVIATTSIWADVASHVGCGAEVPTIIPAGADPHTFEASLRDREQLEGADVVIANGRHLEESLHDLLDTLAASGVDVIEVADQIEPPAPVEGGSHDDPGDEPDADSHDHGVDGDPHVWQDPSRVAGALDAIAAGFISAGADSTEIEACTDTYRDELIAVDAEIQDVLASIPHERRVLVTNHDAFGYFADRYDFEIVGTVIPSISTLGESSAGQLAELADVIAEHDVPAIFTEEFASDADAAALADRLGVEVVPLTSDALAADGPSSTYAGMLRANASAIADALA